jgi:hypothetical protein
MYFGKKRLEELMEDIDYILLEMEDREERHWSKPILEKIKMKIIKAMID